MFRVFLDNFLALILYFVMRPQSSSRGRSPQLQLQFFTESETSHK